MFLKCEIPLDEIETSYEPDIILVIFSVLKTILYLLPVPSVISSASVCAESFDRSRVTMFTFLPSDSIAICGEERTLAARMIQSKSSNFNSNLISASGIVNCFSGGVTIMLAGVKRYLILLRPLLPMIVTCFSSNSKDGSSLCREITDKKLFRS